MFDRKENHEQRVLACPNWYINFKSSLDTALYTW